MLTIDYGASFETLTHSFSVDSSYDGIFIPPIPKELMIGLPECHMNWPICAGRIDWTTFVDFTNLAAKGQIDYNWSTVFYGPQSVLEHQSDLHIGSSFVPGYSVLDRVDWVSRHITGWYGNEVLMDPGEQRWTSFKALIQRKGVIPPQTETLTPTDLNDAIVYSASWPLDTTEVDSCWVLDPSNLPLADWIRRNEALNRNAYDTLNNLTKEFDKQLGIDYARNYENAQLGVRLVDYLVRTVGCEGLRHGKHRFQPWDQLRWEEAWPKKVLEFVGPRVISAIINGTEKGLPFECLASRSFRTLCPEF